MVERLRPTVPQVLPQVKALFRNFGAGCCLHIVLSDGNVADSSVQYCLTLARETGHADCIALAETLLKMSKTQRKKLGGCCYEP